MTSAATIEHLQETHFGFLPQAFDNPFTMYETIEAGVPLANLDKLADFVAPGDKRWKYRIVPSATYDRYKRNRKPLSPEISQKVARLAIVIRTAMDIFKDTRAARDFLNRPHLLLKGNTPINLAIANAAGARAVTDVLIAGAYGGGA